MKNNKPTQTHLFEIIMGLEFCNEIEQIGERYSEHCWDIGDKTIAALNQLQLIKAAIIRGDMNPVYADYILALGSMEVYSQLALRFGVKLRTLQDYLSIAKFYAAEQRTNYLALPFSHFRIAKSYGPYLAYPVLDLALKAMDSNGGRPPSAAWLEANLYRVTADPGVLDDIAAVQKFESIAESISVADFVSTNDEDGNPNLLPAPIYYFMNKIKGLVDRLQERLEKIELEPERYQKIEGLILLIKELADELQSASVDAGSRESK